MVKSSLKRKLLRDIRGTMPQFLSIIIMLTLGVAVYVGLDSTWRSLNDYTSQISSKNNLADIQVMANSITEEDVRTVAALDGVERAERRLRLQAIVTDHPEGILETVGLENNDLNTVTIHEGRSQLSQGEAILDLSFAQAHGIRINDKVTIQIQRQKATFQVVGLATSAAYIYATSDTTDVIPDHSRYGFMMVHAEDMSGLVGSKTSFNEMLVKTKVGTDAEQLKNTISSALDSKLIASVTREETRNDLSIKQKIAQYQSIGNLFPFVFFAVVILMTFTTMIRLMNTQRKQIGLLKAVGYTRRQIAIHYMAYGVWISVIGSCFGILIGYYLIPRKIWNFFDQLFVLPDAPIVLYWPKVVLIIILSICSTVLATLYVCLRTEAEQPAELMRLKPSQYGRKILMERISPWWRHLNSSRRLIIRQIFRNKIRLFMTVIGVMGCTALLLTALGMRDTIKNVADTVYEKTYLYKAKYYLEEGVSIDTVTSFLREDEMESISEAPLVISSEERTKMGTIHVLSKDSKFIQFYDEKGQRLELDDNSVLITEKTADIYNVAIGDELQVRLSSDNRVSFTVGAISKVNIGQGLYLSKEAWNAKGLTYQPTAIIAGSEHTSFPDGMISRIVETERQSKDFMTSMDSTLSLSVMMVAAAGVLAFIVLYNLGILNFTERERDLATLLVLGFRQRELRSFVVFENILFTALGIIIGIPAGFTLHEIIFAKSGMGDELDFSAVINNQSIAISVLFTAAIALAVNIALLYKVGKIKMVEALKSVE
ncbi:hypothetical protein A8L34_12045 [Bacillus sp. FJAT-27264]|uniref:ABC transporter permease n=1 Tax=Paenibacillus sp. (strain DSM 101736 / FJAT-27264) TaxID=1850362 RepID=UPI000807C52E|nr:ABC transporter permease [Bacillus sp. FJAT-27264]OBZ14645.1 hypothetical protein A8L34_12045 [Bacillus sp. FJAT-27264]